MDLSVVPYNHSSSTKPDINESDYGDVVEPKPLSNDDVSTTCPSPLSAFHFKYGQCMRNHAASIGGHASDGCGEFMPRAHDGSLACAACGCHRNFHLRQLPPGSDHLHHHPYSVRSPTPPMLMYNVGHRWDHPSAVVGSPLRLPNHRHGGGRFLEQQHNDDDRRSETPEREEVQAQLQMQMQMQQAQAAVGSAGRTSTASCKRSRTKFTQEQKDRMLAFAEKIGWRMQRHDDVALNQFCSEVGVKRNVLKVWMHNNKNAHRRRESGPPQPTQSQPLPPPSSAPPQPAGV